MSATIDNFLDLIAVPVFVLEQDLNGVPRYVQFNQTACRNAGRARVDVVGRTAAEVWDGVLGQSLYHRHLEVFRTGDVMTYEVTLDIRARKRTVRTTLMPQHGANGHVQLVVGTTGDMGGKRRNRIAKEPLPDSDSEIETFVSLAAHDLRTPMRHVRSIADLMRENFVDMGDGKADLIAMLDEVAERSMALITDVLSHTQARQATEAISEFDFGALCADVLNLADPTGVHRALWDERRLSADRTAIQIVLRNLVDNALKHAGRDRVTLNISVAEVSPGVLEFTVRDNGKGFDDPALAFLGGGEMRPESGFGLLGIRRLIQARGGSIAAIAPHDGLGAIVRFTLPGVILKPQSIVQTARRSA